MTKDYQIRAMYEIKIFNSSQIFLPEKPYLAIPVNDMPTKGLKRKARKINRMLKDKIDWSYDNKEKYQYE